MKLFPLSDNLTYFIILSEQMFAFCVEGGTNMKDNRTELLELIDTLSDSQILFFLTFLKRILGEG